MCLGGISSHPFLTHPSLLDFSQVFLGISIISDLVPPSKQLCPHVLPAGLNSSLPLRRGVLAQVGADTEGCVTVVAQLRSVAAWEDRATSQCPSG